MKEEKNNDEPEDSKQLGIRSNQTTQSQPCGISSFSLASNLYKSPTKTTSTTITTTKAPVIPKRLSQNCRNSQYKCPMKKQPISESVSPTNTSTSSSFPHSNSSSQSSSNSVLSIPKVMPITSLHKGMTTDDWLIKAVVQSIIPARQYFNTRTDTNGCLFSFIGKDDSGEIKITGFGSECKRWHDQVKVGKTYFIKSGHINLAYQSYRQTQNDFEIVLNYRSEITECLE